MQVPTVKVADDNPRGWKIINASDFDPARHVEYGAPEPITRDSIAKMKRSDVVALMEAHGVSEADCEGIRVPELRERLTAIMFMGD